MPKIMSFPLNEMQTRHYNFSFVESLNIYYLETLNKKD